MDSEFRSWWIGKNGAQQWSKALDDEGGALGAIEMIFKAGAATQQARIEALESGVQSVVREKKTYKRFNSQSSYDSAFAAYDRMHDAIDALSTLLEQEGD